jgi:Outer membrane protein beta-barrel domain
MKYLAITGCLALLFSGAVSAQEMSHFSFDIGAGFTTSVGDTGRNLNEGWNVDGGFGLKFSPYIGAMIDLGYNSMGVNSTTLANLGYGGGDLHIFSATLDPIVHLNPKGHVDVYVTGGGGIYHRYQDFTQPTVAVGTGFNPFFGFYPFAVPANEVVASYSVNKPGIDAGVGIAFGSKWHGKFFAEARYNRIFMGSYHTDYVPVTFGFRW